MLTTYRHVVIQETMGPPDAHEIEAIEREIGAALPSSFRRFLEVANGGTLEYSVRVPPTPNGEEMMFCDLFHAGKDYNGKYGHGTLIGETQALRYSLKLPERFLPFARDGGGSTVFLDLTDEGGERVMAFVHGLPAWTGLRQQDAMVEVAPSFDDYIARLYLDDDYIEEAFGLLEKALSDKDEGRIQANLEFLNLAIPAWREQFAHRG